MVLYVLYYIFHSTVKIVVPNNKDAEEDKYDVFTKPSKKLFMQLNSLQKYEARLSKEDGKYKVYPIEVDKNDTVRIYHQKLHEICVDYFETEKSLDELFDDKTEDCNREIAEIKKSLNTSFGI